ncbi:MAG: hypothetical protein CMJ64_06270 [Planctomycetaceae bacterium]|nr:hypothetical protein [Planctomycetaceae bacterium]
MTLRQAARTLACIGPHNRVSRRALFQRAAAAAMGTAAWSYWKPALRARAAAEVKGDDLTIMDIEAHDVMVDYEDWIHYELQHFYGPTRRTIYVVRTKNGLVGLGEGGKVAPDVLDHYIGTSPFDHIGDEKSLQLGIAMYDLMGKAAGVPVCKLFGQRYRKWVNVASWTVSCHPDLMANAVKEFAKRGYTWMKYHLSPFENIFDQLDAMQAVAPEGFKLHFDLTMGGTRDHMPDLLEKIAEYPIAGAFEDPLHEKDIEAYARLRQRSTLPILLHHAPLQASFEVLREAADGYILGHYRIGDAMRRAGLFGALEIPFELQNVGGTIMRSMTVHMQAAFKTATYHFNSDTETWKSDVVKERLEPINGMIRVPEKRGLGVTLDDEQLQRLKELKLPEKGKWIIKTTYKNGTTMYNLADPKQSIFMVRPDVRREIPLSYAAPLSTKWWDEDGSAEYRRMFERLGREGVVLERAN